MARSGYFSGPQNEYGTLSPVVLPEDGALPEDPDTLIQRSIEATTNATQNTKSPNDNA